MRILIVVAVASVLNCVPGMAQGRGQMRAAPPEPGLECFAQAPKPEYPETALHEDVTGTVWTTITLTPQDTVGKVDTRVVSAYSDGEKLLVPAVEKAIHAATFKPECAGKTVHVNFRYQIDGVAVANPQPTDRQEPPNVVWIESQPALTTEPAHHTTARR
jgi:hypothetical protein